MKKYVYNMGKNVLCDLCGKNYRDSKVSGGLIIGGHAVCPECEPWSRETIKRVHEEHLIKAECPKDKSFADFVHDYRGDNNEVTVFHFKRKESVNYEMER